jgi:adenosylcobinamide-GDP ribazoletransferase
MVAGTVPGPGAVAVSAASAVLLGLAGLPYGAWAAAYPAALTAGLVCAGLLLRRCVRRFDGITGDVLGAMAETAATGALVALALITPP